MEDPTTIKLSNRYIGATEKENRYAEPILEESEISEIRYHNDDMRISSSIRGSNAFNVFEEKNFLKGEDHTKSQKLVCNEDRKYDHHSRFGN